MSFNLATWYYAVEDSSPAVKVWEVSTGQFVTLPAAGFTTFLNAQDTDAQVGGGVLGTANNGSGLIRVNHGSANASFHTGQQVYYKGVQSGVSAVFTITRIDSTHVDLQASAFTVADTSASLYGAMSIDTISNLLISVINSYNLSLYTAGNFFGAVSQVPANGPQTVTLTNPIVNNYIFNPSFAGNTGLVTLNLPIMSLVGSVPIGMQITIYNNMVDGGGGNKRNIQVQAQDLSFINTLKPGDIGTYTLTVNATKNGTIQAEVLTSAPVRTDRGGTNSGSDPVDGQIPVGGTSTPAAYNPVTMGGDATIVNTGAVTVSGLNGTPVLTSIRSPLHIGGTTASSTLTLESTSGTGTSDAIIFKTGSQVEAARITTAGQLLIGTTTANSLVYLEVNRNVTAPQTPPGGIDQIRITAADGNPAAFTSDTFAQQGFFIMRRANGTAASKTAIVGGNSIAAVVGQGYDGTTYSGVVAGIEVTSWNNWSTTDHSAFLRVYTTPIATTTITEVARFHADGSFSVGNTTGVGFGSINANGVVITKGYTVAALPATAALGKVQGARAYVTDALGPAFLATVVGGGAVVTPVMYNGTNWVVG